MFGLEYIRSVNAGRSGRRSMREQLAGVDYVGKPKRVANNTVRYERADGSTVWRLHRTDVVTKRADGAYVLNTGGWQTVTTKDRINAYAPVRVYQRNHEWFLSDGTPFEDGMVVSPAGVAEAA